MGTNQYIGEARFQLTQESERKLLDWFNYHIPFNTLVMLNSNFEPSPYYVPVVPNETYHQRGIFRALLTQEDTGIAVPVEVRVTYDWKTRSVEPRNYFSSVEFSNVKLDERDENGGGNKKNN